MSFRVCVVGCGSLSTKAHGPSLRRYADAHAGVVLAACCDLDAAKAETYRGRFGFERAYTDMEEMLRVERPAAVCLYAPVDRTCPLGCRILELGFPLLTEKPPGLDGAECRALIAAAERSGAPTQVAFNRRYTPLVRRLKELLAEHVAPGDLHDIRYEFLRVNRRDADFSTTAIHGIDTVRFLAGEDYRHVRFAYQPLPALGPAVANITLDATFPSGATAHLGFYPVTGVVVERAIVVARDHTFFLEVPMWQAFDHPGRLRHLTGGRLVADIAGDADGDAAGLILASGFYAENAAFLDALRAGCRPAGDIRSGLQSVEIADCIRQRRESYPQGESQS